MQSCCSNSVECGRIYCVKLHSVNLWCSSSAPNGLIFLKWVKEWIPLRHILTTYFKGKYGGTLFTGWQLRVEIKDRVDCSCWHNRYDFYLLCNCRVVRMIIIIFKCNVSDICKFLWMSFWKMETFGRITVQFYNGTQTS